jgi:hypothetical protein
MDARKCGDAGRAAAEPGLFVWVRMSAEITGGLAGTAFCVELHQQREKTVRQLLRQVIEGSKLLADRCLERAETQGFVASVMFAEFREFQPFLRLVEKQCANS